MRIQNKFKYFCWATLLLALLAFAGCTRPELTPGTLVRETADFLLETDADGDSDWSAFALARWNSESSPEWFDRYYAAVEARVTQCGGVLHERKYTEYSRLVLALTALDKDPRDVAGYNLLLPLADFDRVTAQGVNGAIMALLALDSGNYEIPNNPAAATQATREGYLTYILDAQLSDGGWSLAGEEAEIDLTAMAIQALANYRDRDDVVQAIENALTVLSQRQNNRGGYTAYNVDSSEAVSQAIIALAALEIPLEDPRFVKDGRSLLDALRDFRQRGGGFAHLLDGKTDALATEQALCALIALVRMEQGRGPLYQIR